MHVLLTIQNRSVSVIRTIGSYGKCFMFLCLLITTVSLSAQINSWNHSLYTIRNGLPSNNVRNCIQDRDGFIWVATESGLSRFDGYHFKTLYHNDRDSTSLPSDNIIYIELTESGQLIASTLNGLFVMNTRTMKGRTIRIKNRKGWENNENYFGVIHINKSLKLIEVQTVTSIHYFDYQFKLVKSCEHPEIEAHKGKFFINGPVCFLPNGDVIYYSNYKFRFEYLNYRTGKFLPCSESENAAYACLKNIQNINKFNWDQDQNLWYVKHNVDSLFVLDRYSQQQYQHELRGKLKKINWTSNINFTNRGTVLMPYSEWDANELYEFSIHDFKFNKKFRMNPESFSGFTLSVATLFIDKDSNWWIGSLDGLYFLKRDFHNFERIDLPVPYRRKYDWQYVTSIHVLNKDELFITTYAEHCFLYNQRTNTIKSYLDSVPIANAWNHCMHGIIQLGTDRRLIAGCSDYLFSQGKLIYPFKPMNRFEQMLREQGNYTFIRADTSHIWISLKDSGLVDYNYADGCYKIYPPNEDFLSNQFQISSFDKQGNLYFVHNALPIVWKYHKLKQQFEKITLPNEDHAINWIRDIAVDDSSNIYINTYQQLIVYSIKNKTKRVIRLEDGLPTYLLNTLYYHNEFLYLLSNSGLGILRTKNQSVRLFDEHDGIIDNITGYYITHDSLNNNILIGGKGCVYRLKPNYVFVIPNRPTIHIDRVMVNSKEVDWHNKELQFSFKNNNVTIDLSSVDFYSGKSRKYVYRFEEGGNHTDWMVSTSNQINLMNLGPGNYHLLFRSTNANQQWSANTVSFKFTILAPWYQRTWVYLIFLLVTAGIIYLIYLYKLKQIKRIEGIRSKLSRDLHDDIGSTLSSINILSNTAYRHVASNQQEKVSTTLQKISERSQRLLLNMNDIIWNIKPENDSLDEMLSRMRSYASTMFEARNITYNMTSTLDKKSIHLDLQVKSNIYLIFKEAVNNLVKYSETKHVDIYVSIEKNVLQVVVQDFGIGFNIHDLNRKNGLDNMLVRAHEMKATLTIQSYPEQGTKIMLSVRI